MIEYLYHIQDIVGTEVLIYFSFYCKSITDSCEHPETSMFMLGLTLQMLVRNVPRVNLGYIMTGEFGKMIFFLVSPQIEIYQ